jgi:hypothetical protein
VPIITYLASILFKFISVYTNVSGEKLSMLSKTTIDKIGEELRRNDYLDHLNLNALLSWRNEHLPTLDYYHSKLDSDLKQFGVLFSAKRLKRIESIHLKLKRFKTMRLSTLQDMAGIRIILNNEIDLSNTFSKLRSESSKNLLKKIDNYFYSPKEDGYRGIHLIYQNKNGILVELQLRTELQHIWATAVEIYGELQSTSFKTGEGNLEWHNFFILLSSYFAIKENGPPAPIHEKISFKKMRTNLITSIKKLHVIEKLNAATYGIDIVSNKHNQKTKTGQYAILELDLDQRKTALEIFNKKDLKKAIEIYTNRELSIKKGEHRNIVFVNMESLEKIQKTYPNYFLNTQKFLEILSKIVLGEY